MTSSNKTFERHATVLCSRYDRARKSGVLTLARPIRIEETNQTIQDHAARQPIRMRADRKRFF